MSNKKPGWLKIATIAGTLAFNIALLGGAGAIIVGIDEMTGPNNPAPAPAPVVSITDMAGYHEGADAGGGFFSSGPLVTPSQWASYQSARGDLASQIAQFRSEGVESKRVQDWFALIDRLKTINDPLTEAELADAWVNTNIVSSRIDPDNAASTPQDGRPQTPFETLTYGTGGTEDTAVLKYETLRMAGVNADEMRLVASADDMALMLDIAGRNWMFYTWGSPHIPAYQSYHDAATQAAYFFSNSYPMQDQAFAAHDKFTPLAAMNDAGFKFYVKDAVAPVDPPDPAELALASRAGDLSSDTQNAIASVATAAFEDSRNNQDNPEVRVEQFGELQELAGQGAQINRTDSAEWPYYVQNRGDLDQAIQKCLAAPDICEPRFKAWVDLIDLLQSIDDDTTKIAIADAWVNSVIKYNHAKDEIKSTSDPRYSDATWMQSPEKTLRLGSGVCVDFATLKYETLRLGGIDPMRMRLVGGMVPEGGHMILSIDTNDSNWALANAGPPTMPQKDIFDGDQRSDNLWAFASNAYLVSDDRFMSALQFVPQDGLNDYGDWGYSKDAKISLPPAADQNVIPAQLMQNLPPAQAAVLDRVIAEAFAVSGNNPAATNAPADILQTPARPVYMAGLYATPVKAKLAH